jgi:hypothetical protein
MFPEMESHIKHSIDWQRVVTKEEMNAANNQGFLPLPRTYARRRNKICEFAPVSSGGLPVGWFAGGRFARLCDENQRMMMARSPHPRPPTAKIKKIGRACAKW